MGKGHTFSLQGVGSGSGKSTKRNFLCLFYKLLCYLSLLQRKHYFCSLTDKCKEMEILWDPFILPTWDRRIRDAHLLSCASLNFLPLAFHRAVSGIIFCLLHLEWAGILLCSCLHFNYAVGAEHIKLLLMWLPL